MGRACLLVVLVVVHRGDGVEHLLVVVVHAQRVATLRQDDQKACDAAHGVGNETRGRNGDNDKHQRVFLWRLVQDDPQPRKISNELSRQHVVAEAALNVLEKPPYNLAVSGRVWPTFWAWS